MMAMAGASQPEDGPSVEGGEVVDLTLQAASEGELRRRAAEGDHAALAELTRREPEGARAA